MVNVETSVGSSDFGSTDEHGLFQRLLAHVPVDVLDGDGMHRPRECRWPRPDHPSVMVFKVCPMAPSTMMELRSDSGMEMADEEQCCASCPGKAES